MLKDTFDVREAELVCFVDFPIEHLCARHAESFLDFLEEQAPLYRDTAGEGLEFLRSQESGDTFDTIRYFFSTPDSAKRDMIKVARMIDGLGKQWNAIEGSDCDSMPEDDELIPLSIDPLCCDDCSEQQAFSSIFYNELARRYGDEYAAFQAAWDRQCSNFRH